MPVKYHQRTFSLENPHELCYTSIWRNTYQHMDMINTSLCSEKFIARLPAQFAQYFPHIPFALAVNPFPPVLWCKHDRIPGNGSLHALCFSFRLCFSFPLLKPSMIFWVMRLPNRYQYIMQVFLMLTLSSSGRTGIFSTPKDTNPRGASCPAGGAN